MIYRNKSSAAYVFDENIFTINYIKIDIHTTNQIFNGIFVFLIFFGIKLQGKMKISLIFINFSLRFI